MSYMTAGVSYTRPRKGKLDIFKSNKFAWENSYNEFWDPVKKKLLDIVQHTQSDLVQNVIDFISTYSFTPESIPTIALFTGVNLSDHEDFFHALNTAMKTETRCHPVTLESHHSSVKNLIESMVHDFIETADWSDDEDGETDVKRTRKNYSMSNLQAWFHDNYGSLDSKDFKYLAIVVPDIGKFRPSILQEFVTVLSTYRDRLPFVMFFGISTTLSVIDNMFPYFLMSKLALHIFQSHSPILYLNSIVDKVLLSPSCPLQLGAEVCKLLIYNFLQYNYSVKEFVSGIQLCAMEHFISDNLYNVLCCHQYNIRKTVDALGEKELASILNLDSMQKYNSQRKCDHLPQLTVHYKDTKKELIKLLKELHKHIENFHFAVRIVNIMVQDIPDSPFGHDIRENYVALMDESEEKSNLLNKCLQLWNLLSKYELLDKFKAIVRLLENHIDAEICKLAKTMTQYIEKIDKSNLEVCLSPGGSASAESPNRNRIKEDENSSPSKNMCTRGTGTSPVKNTIRNRAQFKTELRVNLTKDKKVSEFDIVKKEALDFIVENFFKVYLKPLTKYPLHEALIFNDTESIKRKKLGTHSLSLYGSLRTPHHYLECQCCGIDESDSNMPDVCIAFKLYSESGSQINLYDWLQAFNQIINKENADSEEIPPNVYIRFSQAVKELQLLGFIAPSKTKVEHVMKLVF